MIGRFARIVSVIRLRVRHGWCRIVNGRHELYEQRSRTRLCQACLLCGYETPGWQLESAPRLRAYLPGRPSPHRAMRSRWMAA